MYKIIKKQGKIVEAYKLGEDNVLFKNLQKENKLLDLHNGKYEVFSQEAVQKVGMDKWLKKEIGYAWIVRDIHILARMSGLKRICGI